MCFNPNERGHSIFGVVYFNLIIFGAYVSTYSLEGLLTTEELTNKRVLALFLVIASVVLIITEKTHGDLISEIYSKI